MLKWVFIPWEGKAKWELLNTFYLGFYCIKMLLFGFCFYLKLLNREKLLLRCLYWALLSLTSVDIPVWVSWGRGVCMSHVTGIGPDMPGVQHTLLLLLGSPEQFFNQSCWKSTASGSAGLSVFFLHSVMWLTLLPDACKLNLCMCCCNLAFKTHLVCAYTHAGGYDLVHYTTINPANMGQENAVLILQQFLETRWWEASVGFGICIKQTSTCLRLSFMCVCIFPHSQEEFLYLCWHSGTAEPVAGLGQCPPLCGYHRRTVVCTLGEEVCSPGSCVIFECPSTLPLPRKQIYAVFLRRNKPVGSVLCQKTFK